MMSGLKSSWKWVQASVRGGCAMLQNCCSDAASSPTPSYVSVPLPNSSQMMREWQVALFNMPATCGRAVPDVLGGAESYQLDHNCSVHL